MANGRNLVALGLALTLAAVGAAVVNRTRSPSAPFVPTDRPLLVEARGRDYFWRFRYAGPDERFNTSDDVQVDEELRLPLDVDVVLTLESDDFVYAMSIPQLKLREIAVPELTFKLEFHTSAAGSFDVLADPLCAVRLFHDEFMGRVVIQQPREFEQWIVQQQGG